MSENSLEYENICLQRENHKLQEKLWRTELKHNESLKDLELKNEELRYIIKGLTKGKLPCNPDHNGECLVCDCWLSDCPFLNKENKD